MIYTQIQGEFQEDNQIQTNPKYSKTIFLLSILFIFIIILLYLQLYVPSTSLHPTLLEANVPVIQPMQSVDQKQITKGSETKNYQQTSQILQNWNNKKFDMKNESKDQIQNQYWHKMEVIFDVQFEENEGSQIQVEIDNQIRSAQMVQSGITDAQLEIAVDRLHKPIKIKQNSLTPSPTPPPGPHFCILVPTYNNHPQSRNLQNLLSLLSQSYPNYHIILIDDASTDTTSEQLSHYIKQKGIKESKVKLIKNNNRKMALQNIYEVGRTQCQFHHVVAVVDGDDWILGEDVLERVARVFEAGDVWVVYGNFVTSGGGLGYSRPYHPLVIEHNKYRIAPFSFSHPRFFYCKLLHLLNPLDLQDQNGKYFSTATDVALYLPILEMSNKRVKYMNEIMYVYRRGTGLNNYQIRLEEQRRNEEIIRKRKKYRKLKILFKEGLP